MPRLPHEPRLLAADEPADVRAVQQRDTRSGDPGEGDHRPWIADSQAQSGSDSADTIDATEA